MYYNGQGVTQNNKETVKWFTLSAEQGYTDAQYNLGLMYGLGEGVIEDFIRGYMWINIVASNGSNLASGARDFLAKKMTPSQISEAQKLARECVTKNYKGC